MDGKKLALNEKYERLSVVRSHLFCHPFTFAEILPEVSLLSMLL